jgi:hypothetical protein
MMPVVGIIWLLGVVWNSRWLWRLTRQVRPFGTVTNDRIVLHFEPALTAGRDMQALLRRCEAELDRLTHRFGSPLRGRAVVYLFRSYTSIAKIFGPRYGGAALPLANAIVIAEDNQVVESIRHEFAHLFSARWSEVAPPLLCEGLSVWLQDTTWGQSIDAAARPLLGNPNSKLPLLLKSTFFFSERQRHACYILAGSFTGFLIRRYGWQRFRDLYRKCKGTRFRAKFLKCFGLTLEKAEWQWRNELTVLEVLKRRTRRSVSF